MTVVYEKKDGIAYVRMNRPEVKNAIDPAMDDAMWEIFNDFKDDDSVGVAILTGTGDSFCAGADLKKFIPSWVGATPWDVRQRVTRGLGGITRGIHDFYKPVIGAINGWALAGGLEIALACDIRIAAASARFGSYEPRRGYHHGDGGIVRLVNICGVGAALEMLLTADPIDAERALQMNMVSKVVPDDELIAAAEATARSILRNDQSAVRFAKETILSMVGKSLEDQLRLEALYGYSIIANPTTSGRLQQFYDRTDQDRQPAS
ncbi:enoyl-CoA hydratase/isomerase family protein [Acrocarpospora catenulata]|uniref:enoyl-CoA hydratase/isomerase family protein n=1 Tax=Acrocarpospora catenulata TaxID=2836182 RepID=UPI001BDB1409|nr:enoyl-CoA hydratase/isomerase family protein [Acrocarpospora catenulata]